MTKGSGPNSTHPSKRGNEVSTSNWKYDMRCQDAMMKKASQLRKARYIHTNTQMGNREALSVWKVHELLGANVSELRTSINIEKEHALMWDK